MRGPQEVIDDPQLRLNDIIVPLEGAGGKLTSTISSPIQVHGVTKVPAKRAPDLGEHNEEVLEQLGFSATEIDGLHASGAVPDAKEHARWRRRFPIQGSEPRHGRFATPPARGLEKHEDKHDTNRQVRDFSTSCLHPHADQVGGVSRPWDSSASSLNDGRRVETALAIDPGRSD